MKIVKIQQSELMEGYEDATRKYERAYIDFGIIGGAWIIVIYLVAIGYLTVNFL